MNFISQQNYHTLSKIRIDLTFLKGLKNVQVKAKEFELMKSGHLSIKVLIEDTLNNIKYQQKFQTKNENWNNWQKHLTPHLSNSIDNFKDVIAEGEIENQTNIIFTRVTEYFGLTQA